MILFTNGCFYVSIRFQRLRIFVCPFVIHDLRFSITLTKVNAYFNEYRPETGCFDCLMLVFFQEFLEELVHRLFHPYMYLHKNDSLYNHQQSIRQSIK